MSGFRFYRCEEVRCPYCGKQLEFLKAKEGDPLLLSHPASTCSIAGKEFYAAPLVVELEEYRP